MLINMEKIKIGIIFSFPTVLVLSAPIRYFKDTLYPNFDPQQWPFISSNGFLNRFLAGHAFEIFITSFIILNSYKLWLVYQKVPLLPVAENINDNNSTIDNTINNLQSNKSDLNLYKQIEHTELPISNTRYVSIQVIKLSCIYLPIVLFIVWFFGASIYDRIYRSTGGYCVNHPELKYYKTCVSKGYTYTGGFKCSGHGLITSTFASCLAFETISLNNWISYINKINPLPFHIHRFGHLLLVVSAYLYVCWLLMFTVTCLFYHTFFERVIGTSCGILIFAFIYIKCKL